MITAADRDTLRSLMEERDATVAAIIRAATCGPISEKDAAMLCLVCGLAVDEVLPPQQRRIHTISPESMREWEMRN